MTSIQRIETVEEILKNTGRLRREELVKRLMTEYEMNKQGAYNAIDRAVELGKVKREDREKGKKPVVYFTVHFDIEENEKNIFEFCEKGLKQFDIRFNFFKDKFANLTTDEKAKGLESFGLLFLHLHVATQELLYNFGEVNEWKILLDKINSRIIPMNDLARSVPAKEQSIIKKHVIEKKVDIINDAFIGLDEFLNELRGR